MNEMSWVIQEASSDPPLREGVRRYGADLAKYRITVLNWLFLFVLGFVGNGLFFGLTIAVVARMFRLSPSATIGIEVAFAGLAASLVPSRTLDRRRTKALSFELLVSERVARATIEGEGPMEILRPQASRVLQTPKMIWILCDTPRRSFCVSSATENYETLMRTFHAWASVEKHDAKKERQLRRSEEDYCTTIDARDAALEHDPSLADELAHVRQSSMRPTETKTPPPAKRIVSWITFALVQLIFALLLFSKR
jgi:hypothetical protein